MGACAILPRIIGHGRASELLYTGRFISGDEAGQWGFYNLLVPPEILAAETKKLADLLASGPTFAHAMTKRCLRDEWGMTIEKAIDHEARVQARCMETEDFERAYLAFAAKTTPRFEGN